MPIPRGGLKLGPAQIEAIDDVLGREIVIRHRHAFTIRHHPPEYTVNFAHKRRNATDQPSVTVRRWRGCAHGILVARSPGRFSPLSAMRVQTGTFLTLRRGGLGILGSPGLPMFRA